jgi:hypothetical protein
MRQVYGGFLGLAGKEAAMQSGFPDVVAGLATSASLMMAVLVIGAWSYVWKGIALWKAARRDQVGWYIVLLIINTAGILEIIYVFVVAPRHPEMGRDGAPAAEG